MEENNISSPVFILLPICVELEIDVFLKIFKNVIGRSKLDKDAIDISFKLGMSGDEFLIKEEDLSINWNILKSIDEQKRATKLLGYWANNNFPSLGKKLYERSWKPPERQNLTLKETAKEISPDEVDRSVFRKLELRVLQLNVNKSTVAKFRHFVFCPANIGKSNEFQVSDKVKSFDVDNEWKEKCWTALKLGTFSLEGCSGLDSSTEMTQTESPIQQDIDANEGNSASRSARKRTHTQAITDNSGNTTDSHTHSNSNVVKNVDDLQGGLFVGGMSTQALAEDIEHPENLVDDSIVDFRSVLPNKRPHLCIKRVDVNCANVKDMTCNSRIGSPSVLHSRTCRETVSVNIADVNDDQRIDTIQTVMLDMRKDMVNITELFGSTIADKDKEIARLNSSLHELIHMNQILSNNETNMKQLIDNHAVIITALQRGSDANSKLLVQSESDLSAKTHLIDTMKIELTAAKNEKEILSAKLEVSENSKRELEGVLEKTKTELNDAKVSFSQKEELNSKLLVQSESDLSAKTHLIDTMKIELTTTKNEKEIMSAKLEVSENSNRELEWALEHSKTELNDAKVAFSQKQELNSKLLVQSESDLSAKTHLIDTMEMELIATKNEKEIMSAKLEVSENSNRELESVLEHTKTELNDAKVAFSQREELQKELNLLKDSVNEMVPQLQLSIVDLETRLVVAETQNAVSNEEKRKSEEELKVLRLQFDLLLPEISKSDTETQTETSCNEIYTQTETPYNEVYTQTETPYNEVYTQTETPHNEVDTSAEKVTNDIESNGGMPSDKSNNQGLHSEEIFVSDDPIVQKCRPLLLKLQFGWVKLHMKENGKYYPAFIYPVDSDGKRRAQEVTADGYVSDVKNIFFDIAEGNDIGKKKTGFTALNKFNKKFGFSYN